MERIINQYAYHRFLPEELHQDADALIGWQATVLRVLSAG